MKVHVIVKDDDIIVDHIGDVASFKHVSEFTISAVRMERGNYTVSNTHGISSLYSDLMHFGRNKTRWNLEHACDLKDAQAIDNAHINLRMGEK